MLYIAALVIIQAPTFSQPEALGERLVLSCIDLFVLNRHAISVRQSSMVVSPCIGATTSLLKYSVLHVIPQHTALCRVQAMRPIASECWGHLLLRL